MFPARAFPILYADAGRIRVFPVLPSRSFPPFFMVTKPAPLARKTCAGETGLRDHPIERMFRDAKLTQIFEGANQIQKMIIGREISRGR